MYGQVDTGIYIHSWQEDRQHYIGLPCKILFIAMSHGQKYLKTAVLNHFFGLEEGKIACSRIFFSSTGKALLTLRYILCTFPSCLMSLLTLFCFSTVRKYANSLHPPQNCCMQPSSYTNTHIAMMTGFICNFLFYLAHPQMLLLSEAC